jgi:hypothetical protein
MYRGHPDRLARYRRERLRLARAVIDFDDELAVLAARRCARMSHDWLIEELFETVGAKKRARRKKS